MMDPTGRMAYHLAMSHIKDIQQEADRQRLIADLERSRPGRFDRLCVSAGGRMVSLGKRLQHRGEIQWAREKNRAAGT